jgi:hypothetical protein
MSARLQTAQRWIGTAEFCAIYGTSRQTVVRWAKQGRIQSIRVPPHARGRIYIRDPEWLRIDPPNSGDPSEWLCILRQCDVAHLLNVTPRALRYMEAAGKAKFRLVGHRKLYSLSEVRRLLAQRQNGRAAVTRSERDRSLLQWARWKLKSRQIAV